MAVSTFDGTTPAEVDSGWHVRQVAPMNSQPPDARGGSGGKAAGKGGGEQASRKEDKGSKVSFESSDKPRGQAKPGAKSSPLGGGGPLGKRPSVARLVRRIHAAWALISCLRLSRDVRTYVLLTQLSSTAAKGQAKPSLRRFSPEKRRLSKLFAGPCCSHKPCGRWSAATRQPARDCRIRSAAGWARLSVC